jgi:hypothetical protein
LTKEQRYNNGEKTVFLTNSDEKHWTSTGKTKDLETELILFTKINSKQIISIH